MSYRFRGHWQYPHVGKIQDALYLLWRDRVGGLALRVSLLLTLFLLLVVAFSFWRIPPEIPLAYSRPWGFAQLVPSAFLFVLIAFVVLFFISNSTFAGFLISTEQLLARIIIWNCALAIFLIDIAVLRVVLLVT